MIRRISHLSSLLLMAGSLLVSLEVDDAAYHSAMQDAREALINDSELHEAMSRTLIDGHPKRGLIGVTQHIRSLAPTRHATAIALGAKPIGYLSLAAKDIIAASDAEGAGFTIQHNAAIFGRTFRPAHITIQDNKWLCIPADARTYSKSPEDFEGELDFVELIKGKFAVFFWAEEQRAKTGEIAQTAQTAQRPESAPQARKQRERTSSRVRKIAFKCVKEVHQEQDRTLLPSDETILKLCAAAANDLVTLAIEKRTKTTPPSLA